MKTLKYIYTLLFTFGFLAVLTVPVAAGVGVSPANIQRNNLRPGTSVTDNIIISQSNPDSDLQVSIVPEMGEANDWITFNPGREFTIEAGVQRYPLQYTISVPDGVELKPYNGVIRIRATELGVESQGAISVVKGARVEVDLVTTEVDFVEFRVRSLDIEDIEGSEEISLAMNIENEGNLPVAPSKVEIDILNLNEQILESHVDEEFDTVAVGETKVILANFEHSLPKGEYFADVKIYNGSEVVREERIVFNVLSTFVPMQDTPQDSGFTAIFTQVFGGIPTVVLAVVLGVLAVAILLLAAYLSLFRRSQDKGEATVKQTATVAPSTANPVGAESANGTSTTTPQ